MNLFKKQSELHDRVLEHLDKCLECHDVFMVRSSEILGRPKGEEALAYAREVGRLESEADSVRRRIIANLLKGQLLPQSRREILSLIEKTDDIANESEEIMRELYLQAVVVKDDMAESFRAINQKTSEQLKLLRKAVDTLFSDPWGDEKRLRDLCIEIDGLESAVDELEQAAIEAIYRSGLSLAEKNQLRFFATKFADVSDVAEDIADLLEKIMIIRRV